MSKKFKDYLTEQTFSYTIALCAAVGLFMALSNIPVVVAVWNKIISVLSPFIYAFALAFVLNRPVIWFENKVFQNSKNKKALSILVVYILFAVSVSGLLTAVLPQLGLSISYMIDTLPGMLVDFYDYAMDLMNKFHWSRQLIAQIEMLWSRLMTTITEFSLSALPDVLNYTVSVGSGAVKLIMILIISVYMLTGKDNLLFQFKKATYAYFSKHRADRMVEIAHRSSEIFSGFIIGKLIDSTIIGILAFIGMAFIYPPYTALIAVIIGVTNMIPFFGPFICAIPCIFILFVVSPMTSLIFAVFVFLLQQFDGNILGPKILGDSLGMSPIWVLVGILVGNGLFGLVGMLIGVPTFAVIYNLVSENISDRLNEKSIIADSDIKNIEFDGVENAD